MTAPFEQYRAVEALETALGDPFDPTNEFSLARAMERDEADAFPQEALSRLDDWGLNEQYIPIALGGKFRSWEELFALFRAISRRDLTVTAAHWTTCLAGVTVWLDGNEQQKAALAALIRRRELVAIGLTERAHGADLLANEVRAERLVGGGYRLHGEKWLLNNATHGAALTLFARTEEAGGPRAFSVFFVEKATLVGEFSHAPRERTLGITGTDISGIRFAGCLLPPEALLEPSGSGLEATLRTFQVTRPICAALSLGAADTCLRTTVAFARWRQLYGETVFAIPYVQRLLTEAFADLLIAECVSISSMRALHTIPEQMSVLSASVKYLAPVLVEELLHGLSVVLGARFFLRSAFCHGIFQKALRDNAIVSIFDGSTAVNLNAIALQLRHLAEFRAKQSDADNGLQERLSATFDLSRTLPPFAPERLALLNRGRDDLTLGLLAARGQVRELGEEAYRLLEGLAAEVERLDREVGEATARHRAAFGRSVEAYDLAHRYCALQAAGACVQMWLHNREQLPGFFGGGEWLRLCLGRLLGRLRPGDPSTLEESTPAAMEELARMFEGGWAFSLLPQVVGGDSGQWSVAGGQLGNGDCSTGKAGE